MVVWKLVKKNSDNRTSSREPKRRGFMGKDESNEASLLVGLIESRRTIAGMNILIGWMEAEPRKMILWVMRRGNRLTWASLLLRQQRGETWKYDCPQASFFKLSYLDDVHFKTTRLSNSAVVSNECLEDVIPSLYKDYYDRFSWTIPAYVSSVPWESEDGRSNSYALEA